LQYGAVSAKFSLMSSTRIQDYGDEMRACHATSEIEEEECIIEIPLKCLITVEMGKETNVRILLYSVDLREIVVNALWENQIRNILIHLTDWSINIGVKY
jgi:hypothetical protein